MMKSLLLVLVLFAVSGVVAGEKANMKFDEKSLDWSLRAKVCSLLPEKDGITIVGKKADKNNSWRAASQSIALKEVAGRQFKFGGKVKADVKEGRFVIAIREVNAKGRSVTYQRVEFSKPQDWKEFEKSFKANGQTASLQFYVIGEKLGDGSSGSVKGLYIEAE